MRFHDTSLVSPAQKPRRKAFSLVEVVLAVGVLAVSVLALLGMMGPAFRQAKGVTETNAATAVIGKLNATLQSADFADIHTMVNASANAGQVSSPPADPNKLGIFIFYTEESFDTGASKTRYRDRVAYYAGGATINNASKNGWQTLASLADALDPSSTSDWRVMPPVIAVVISLSPIVKDQSESGTMGSSYDAATPFASTSRLFPKYTLPPVDSYPLGMLPIMASVFVVPNPVDDITGNTFNSNQAQSFLTLQNRIFTFQAVKLR